MERPAHETPRIDGEEGLDAPQHLPGRLVREGQEQDARGIRPGLDQARHAVDQSPGLARPGAGNDEDRPPARQDDGPLLVVQFPVIVDPVGDEPGRGFQDIPALHPCSLGQGGPDVILLACCAF